MTYPWTSSRLSKTCTNTLYRHQTRTKHGVASDATCSSKCWKKNNRRRRRWGYRFVAPNPWWQPEERSWDRAGPPSPRHWEMETSPNAWVQPSATTAQLLPVLKKKKGKKKAGVWTKKRSKPWREENCAWCSWTGLCGVRPSKDWVKAACVCEHVILNVAPHIKPTRPRPSSNHHRISEGPRLKESKQTLATQETRTSTGWCWAQIQNCQVESRKLRPCCPLPHVPLLPSLPSLPLPPHPSPHLSLLLLLLFVSASSPDQTARPIRNTPRQCVGTNDPPCGPASPSWGRPPHGRGPDGRTDSRVARVDGGACRTRSLGAEGKVGRKWPR